MAFDAADGAGSKVRDEADLFADECGGVIVQSNAAHDGAVLQSVGKFELQEFLAFLHFLAGEDGADADVKFLKVLKGNGRQHGFCTIGGSLAFLLLVLQFLHLCFNHSIFDFFEEQFGLSELMSGGQEVCAAKTVPLHFAESEHVTEFLRREGEEGFKGDGEVGDELGRKVEDGFHALRVSFDDFPGFGVGKIFVADACEVHRLFLCVAEAEVFQEPFHFGFHSGKFRDGFAVVVCQFAGSGHDAFIVFLSQLQCAVHEVSIDRHEFIVVACLEVLPSEVVVLCLRCVGSEDVAQDVLFSGEFSEIFVKPDGVVAGGGNLVVFKIQKLIGGHVVGQDVGAFRFEHGGEDDAVEDDVVLADEMDESRFGVLPPLFPVVGQDFFCVGDVADGRIEPNVEYFSVGSFHGHGDSPVKVSTDGSRLQSHVEPGFALSEHVGAPFRVVFENPLLEPFLVAVEGQIPVLSLSQNGFCSADGASGIDEFSGREGSATFLALITVGTFRVAVRAFAGDVSVGEEGLCLFVIVLFAFFLDELTFVVAFSEEVRRSLSVHFGGGSSVVVERDAELLEGFFDDFVVAVHDLLGCASLFARSDGDGHAVFVRTTDEEHFAFFQAEIAHVDVGGDVNSRKVSDVDAAVGVGQRGGHGGALERSV